MDAIEYAAGVQSFKESEILSSLLNLTVAVSDLQENLKRIHNNGVDLTKVTNEWIITKGLTKFVQAQGLGMGSLPETIEVCLNSISGIIPEVQKQIKEYNEKVWDGKLLTLKQVNILNLIEHLGFWIKFTRMIFDVLLTMNNHDTNADNYLSKYDTRWINGTDQFYRQLTVELLKGSRAVITRLSEVPDVEVSRNSLDVLESVETGAKVDLLRQGFGVHLVNPIFWYDLMWSKINLKRIEQMRRENEMFAMKISQAINKKAGGNDPQLERHIEIYQDEILKNSVAIEKIEKKYA